jgi:hypothetical protein
MKFAYADPPYLGCGARLYGKLHPDAADWDRPETHRALIERLCDEFEAWALSLHVPSLKVILPMCPQDVRIGAWAKPFCVFKDRNVAHAWEPVIWRGGRKRPRTEPTVRDWVAVSVMGQHARNKVTLDGKTFPGSKPPAFCWWVFDILGAEPADDFHDLFPGSGAVGRAWEQYKRAKTSLPLFAEATP